MKLVGLCVTHNEDDIVEAFVRHNLTLLDQLYVVDDGSTDGTPAILDKLAQELPGLRLLPLDQVRAISASPLQTGMLALARAQNGAATYFALDADEFLQFDGDRDFVRGVFASAGNLFCHFHRVCVLADSDDTIDVNKLGPRRFRSMEIAEQVQRVGGPQSRKIIICLTHPDSATEVSYLPGAHAAAPGHSLAVSDCTFVSALHVPIRSLSQVEKRLATVVADHARRLGTTATLPPPLLAIQTILDQRPLTGGDLLPLSAAWVSSAQETGLSIAQGDLSGLFRYTLAYRDLQQGPGGAVLRTNGRAIAELSARNRDLEAELLRLKVGPLMQAGDLAGARALLEPWLRVNAAFDLMEMYFDIIERQKAADVPVDLLKNADRLSNPQRFPVGRMPDGRLFLSYMEMDISYACNLRCEGCSHYSNYAMPGVVRLGEARAWMANWAERIVPAQFRLLGGEPAINPDAAHIIRAAAEIFPHARRSLVSNGLLLRRRTDMMQALAETGTSLHISLHDRDPAVQTKLRDVMTWSLSMGITTTYSEDFPDDFTRLYQGTGKDIRPFEDKQPFAAWGCCSEKNCTCIHEGLIWKCPPLAFLNILDKKIKLTGRPEWEQYLKHRGLPPTASTDELYAYLAYPERDCDMCPAIRPD